MDCLDTPNFRTRVEAYRLPPICWVVSFRSLDKLTITTATSTMIVEPANTGKNGYINQVDRWHPQLTAINEIYPPGG